MSALVPGRPEIRRLRQWTEARIALGRVGASMPTAANLDFSADHAAARDAVHSVLDVETLTEELEAAGFLTLSVRSQAENRAGYLRRPDLGRRLHTSCVEILGCDPAPIPQRLTVIVADGLSSAAPQRYAAALLQGLRAQLRGWMIDRVVIAQQARVALGDEIGSLRGAEAVLMLLGERPGLKAADSLGAYLTYAPRVGLTDASRNCVSSIREGGLGIPSAVTRLVYLLSGARALGTCGVALKDHSEMPQLKASHAALPRSEELNALLDATAVMLYGETSEDTRGAEPNS